MLFSYRYNNSTISFEVTWSANSTSITNPTGEMPSMWQRIDLQMLDADMCRWCPMPTMWQRAYRQVYLGCLHCSAQNRASRYFVWATSATKASTSLFNSLIITLLPTISKQECWDKTILTSNTFNNCLFWNYCHSKFSSIIAFVWWMCSIQGLSRKFSGKLIQVYGLLEFNYQLLPL